MTQPSHQALKLLAFDTSTEQMSLALTDGMQIWSHTSAGGAQASSQLIPQALALLQQAGLRLQDLDALVVGQGPGSFTGVRTACSVAQGFGWGANLPVIPIETLLVVAEDARWTVLNERAWAHAAHIANFAVVIDARMDEVYGAAYAWSSGNECWRNVLPLQAGSPETLGAHFQKAVWPSGSWALGGSAFDVYGERLPSEVLRVPATPSAHALLRLAPRLWAQGAAMAAQQVQPLYIRDKVAHTSAEREMIKAAKAVASAAAVAGEGAGEGATKGLDDTAGQVLLEFITEAHLQEVVQVEQLAYAHPWTLGNFKDALKAGYVAQKLVMGERVVGYYVAMPVLDEVHLLNITVAPAFQGQGWARCLMQALDVCSRGQGAKCMWLEVRESNVRAMKIYKAHGFVQVGLRKDYYPAGRQARESAVVMRMALNALKP
jgi:tRNA threonylcarbamoyladenosine biosynthesis protein TsaB